jgi:hypothetical protein
MMMQKTVQDHANNSNVVLLMPNNGIQLIISWQFLWAGISIPYPQCRIDISTHELSNLTGAVTLKCKDAQQPRET